MTELAKVNFENSVIRHALDVIWPQLATAKEIQKFYDHPQNEVNRSDLVKVR
jgi:hypothetical protein